MISPSAITLGTATLGMAYGIANPKCLPTAETAVRMLDMAWEAGITCLDTAPAYGEAESRIGQWIRSRGSYPTIITKLPSLARVSDRDVEAAVKSAIGRSTAALGVSTLGGYLTHDATDYIRPAVHDCLGTAFQNNLISAYGPSVYTSDDVRAAITCGPPHILQLPLNALDQRMVSDGALKACREAGIIVFSRSVFLQGLMLMAPTQVPAELSGLTDSIAAFQTLASNTQLSPSSLALRFVQDVPGISSVVVGAHSPEQLSELLAAANASPLEPETVRALEMISKNAPQNLLDPRRWPQSN